MIDTITAKELELFLINEHPSWSPVNVPAMASE